MALDERIRIIIDVAADRATSAVKGFRQSVADAEGATGKLKAGASSAFDTVRANAGAMAAAAGTALIGFAIKAASAFQDTALAAGKFADAAGISVAAASRWTEVAGDVGVEAGAVQSAIQKMNQGIAAGKPVFDEYADAIVRGADGMVDADASFQNLITRIGSIADPTERAKAAQEAFGKGYSQIAELMEMSATDLKAALDGVSEAKIIDEDELRKARDSRARIDELKDSFEDVQLAVGEFVSSMSPAVTKVLDIAKGIVGVTTAVTDFLFVAKPASSEADRWWNAIGGSGAMSRGEAVAGIMARFNEQLDNKSLFDQAIGGWRAFGSELVDVGDNTDAAARRFAEFKNLFAEVAAKSPETAEQLLTDFGRLREGTDEASLRFQEWAEYVGLTDERIIELANSIPAATEETKAMGSAAKGTGSDLADLDKKATTAANAIRANEDAARGFNDAYRALMGTLDARDAWANVQEAMWNFHAATDVTEQQTRDYTRTLGEFIAGLEGVPEETKANLLAQLNEGDIAVVEAYLRTWEKGVNVPVRFKGQGDVGFMKQARGGPTSGRPTMVGENFDGSPNSTTEMIIPGTGGTTVPAPDVQSALRSILGESGGGAAVVDNSVTNIYMPHGSRPDDVLNAQRRYRRTQGAA